MISFVAWLLLAIGMFSQNGPNLNTGSAPGASVDQHVDNPGQTPMKP